jgi:DNA-binding HxlR family transcriptional regulator
MEEHRHSQHCAAFHRAVELVGKRWTGAILRVLLQRPRRFNDFSAVIPDLSDRLLSERLKELEKLGLVRRVVEDSRPPRVSYQLTQKGKALRHTLGSLDQWAHRWADSG